MLPVSLSSSSSSCRPLLSLSSLTCRRWYSSVSVNDCFDILLNGSRRKPSACLTPSPDPLVRHPVLGSWGRISRFSSLAAAPKHSYETVDIRSLDPETQRKRRVAKYAWSVGQRTSPGLTPRLSKLTAGFLPLPASLSHVTGHVCSCVEQKVLSSSKPSDGPGGGSLTGGQPNKVPPEKLEYVFCELEKNLPRFFSRTHPFNLYDKNMVFEDNIRGLLLKGRDAYMVNLVMLKIKGHIMYGKVDMNILKMTKHPEDGTIRVRWQVLGVSGWRLMLTFWRYGPARVFNMSNTEPVSDITDGFSIFYLNSEGLIHRHMCDKMMPDSSGQENRVKDGKDALPV